MSNITYVERIINRRPFGWTYTDPKTVYHFSFEEIDPFWWHDFVSTHWALAVYAGVAYIVTIFGIQHVMKNRPAFDLRMPLFWWNMGLGIFSIVGFSRFLPGFINVLMQENGFYNSICVKKDTNIPMGFWTLMFLLSKFWELGDTVFIVLRKRPLILLQWYHHLVTMCVVWFLSPYMEPVTRWYTVLNYGVHSLMYPYFAMKSIGTKIPHSFANILTTLQLAQMVVGLTVNMLSMYYLHAGHDDCFRHPTSIKVFGFTYGSFLLLFGKLFYDAVIKNDRKQRYTGNVQKKAE